MNKDSMCIRIRCTKHSDSVEQGITTLLAMLERPGSTRRRTPVVYKNVFAIYIYANIAHSYWRTLSKTRARTHARRTFVPLTESSHRAYRDDFCGVSFPIRGTTSRYTFIHVARRLTPLIPSYLVTIFIIDSTFHVTILQLWLRTSHPSSPRFRVKMANNAI